MASTAKMIGSNEITEPETAVEEREVLLRSTRDEEIKKSRIRDLSAARGTTWL